MRRRETKEIDIENITSEPRKRVQSLEGVMSLLTGRTRTMEFSISNEAKPKKKGSSIENPKTKVKKKVILKTKEKEKIIQKKTTVNLNKKEEKIKRPLKTKIRLSKKQRRESRMND